jgi:2-ketoarginine methyltransferase
MGFVLHEILGQEGEAGLIKFLSQLTDRFPDICIIVIEVDNVIDNPRLMQHGLSLAYYNPYYLLHPFTNQRLESQAFWDNLFEKCQLKILAKEAIDPRVDSTGLEIGYLLQKREGN